jgi:hypothetical protein
MRLFRIKNILAKDKCRKNKKHQHFSAAVRRIIVTKAFENVRLSRKTISLSEYREYCGPKNWKTSYIFISRLCARVSRIKDPNFFIMLITHIHTRYLIKMEAV